MNNSNGITKHSMVSLPRDNARGGELLTAVDNDKAPSTTCTSHVGEMNNLDEDIMLASSNQISHSGE